MYLLKKTPMTNLNEKQKEFQYLINDITNEKSLYYLFTKHTKEPSYKTEYKIIYRLVNLQYDDQIIEKFFKTFIWKNTNLKQNRINSLRSSIQKARVYYNNHKSKFDYEYDIIIGQVDYFTALTVYERVTLRAILRIAKTIGRFDNLQLSLRRIAKKSGITPPAVNNNIKKLIKKEIIAKVKKGKMKVATIYTINKDRILKSIFSKENLKIDSVSVKSSKNKTNARIFGGGELGKTGYLILNMFLDNPKKEFSIQEISKALAISFPTSKKKIDFLEREKYLKSREVKTKGRPKRMYRLRD